MSWTYIVLGVAIVVLVLNIAVVFMLRSWGTGIGSNRETENH
jgi:Na+-transporting methylmalonyl-CoA/oxaloacetate decarboxylase gamma subunit